MISGSPSTGNPPSARAFLIVSRLLFESSKVTVAVFFSVSVENFETPSRSLRIVPTLAAVPAHLHPGTVSLTVFSPAIADWQVIKQKVSKTTIEKSLFFRMITSFLKLICFIRNQIQPCFSPQRRKVR